MSYIQVSIGGKQRGLKFGMYAFEMLGKRVGGLFKEGEMFTSQLSAEVIYAGLMNNCVVKEVAQDFSFEEVNDWVEDMWYESVGQETLTRIFTAFSGSKAVTKGKEVVEHLDDDAKKKVMQMFGTTASGSPSENSDSYQASIIT